MEKLFKGPFLTCLYCDECCGVHFVVVRQRRFYIRIPRLTLIENGAVDVRKVLAYMNLIIATLG